MSTTSEIAVKVIPKSSLNAVAGFENNYLKIKIKAPPEKGKANQELINFLSKTLKIPKSSITIVSGETGRRKRVRFDNLSPKELDIRVQHLLK